MQSSLPKILIAGKDLARFIYGAVLRIISPTPQAWGPGGLRNIRDQIANANGRSYNGVSLYPVESNNDVKVGGVYMSLEIHGRNLMKNIFRITSIGQFNDGGTRVCNTGEWPHPPGGEGHFGLILMTLAEQELYLRYEGPIPDPFRVYTGFERLWRLMDDFEHIVYPYAYLALGENLPWTSCGEFTSRDIARFRPNFPRGEELKAIARDVSHGDIPCYIESYWNPQNHVDKFSPYLKEVQNGILNMLVHGPSHQLLLFSEHHKCKWPGMSRLVFLNCYEPDGKLAPNDRQRRLDLVKQLIMLTSDANRMAVLKDIERRLAC